MSDFFSFRSLITAQLIKIIYVLGALLVTLGSLALLVMSLMRLQASEPTAPLDTSLSSPIAGIAAALLDAGTELRTIATSMPTADMRAFPGTELRLIATSSGSCDKCGDQS